MTHTKTWGKRDPPTLTCAFSKQWKVWPLTSTQFYIHDTNSSWVKSGKYTPHSGLGSDTCTQHDSLKLSHSQIPRKMEFLLWNPFLPSALAAHRTLLEYYFILIVWCKAALWGVCLLFTGCAAECRGGWFWLHQSYSVLAPCSSTVWPYLNMSNNYCMHSPCLLTCCSCCLGCHSETADPNSLNRCKPTMRVQKIKISIFFAVF